MRWITYRNGGIVFDDVVADTATIEYVIEPADYPNADSWLTQAMAILTASQTRDYGLLFYISNPQVRNAVQDIQHQANFNTRLLSYILQVLRNNPQVRTAVQDIQNLR